MKPTKEKLLEILKGWRGPEVQAIAGDIAEQIDNSEYSLVKLGKHDLIIGLGDSGYTGGCSCGAEFGEQSNEIEAFQTFKAVWDYHVMVPTQPKRINP